MSGIAQQIERRNILHNWDFRNPVNQRGASSYTADGYTIDRWVKISGNLTIDIADSFVRLTPTSTGSCMWGQRIEFQKIYSGKRVTLSIRYKLPGQDGGRQILARTNLGNIAASIIGPWSTSAWNIVSSTFTIPDGITSLDVVHYVNNQMGNYIDIESAKLELGDISTLANDPPMDFGRELAICQRYQFSPMENIGVRAVFIQSNELQFLIPTSVSLRIVPQIASQNSLEVRTLNGVGQSGFTFSTVSSKAGVTIAAIKTVHGLTDAYLVVKAATLLDANL